MSRQTLFLTGLAVVTIGVLLRIVVFGPTASQLSKPLGDSLGSPPSTVRPEAWQAREQVDEIDRSKTSTLTQSSSSSEAILQIRCSNGFGLTALNLILSRASESPLRSNFATVPPGLNSIDILRCLSLSLRKPKSCTRKQLWLLPVSQNGSCTTSSSNFYLTFSFPPFSAA